MSTHVVPRSVYYRVFATLLVLTFVTVEVAFVDLGILNTIVALGIACTKATLVILFFMHVRYSTRLTRLVIVGGLLWLAILLLLTLSDFFTRGWMGTPGK